MTWKPDYTTLARAKDYARIADTVDDAQLSVWITAASRAVDRKCNRQFGQEATAVTRTYRRVPSYDPATGLFVLEIDDVQDTTGLLVNGLSAAAAGAVLLPDNAPRDGVPYTRIGLSAWPTPQFPGVPVSNTVTARWGWSAVPVQVEPAVWLQIARWSIRRDSPYGIAGSPDQGSEMRLLSKLDPDVAIMLLGLSRPRRVG